MKNNRSLKAMLSAIWVSLTSGLRSKGFRRAVGMLLVVANLMTTTGMVLAKEMDDETQETSSGIVAAITEEPSSETPGILLKKVLPDRPMRRIPQKLRKAPKSLKHLILPSRIRTDLLILLILIRMSPLMLLRIQNRFRMIQVMVIPKLLRILPIQRHLLKVQMRLKMA